MPSSEKETRRLASLEAVIESATDAIITIDDQGIVQSVNPATERLFGYSADEVIGQNVHILMPSPYHEEHDGYLSNYKNTGDRKVIGIGREVIGKRKDDSTFPMHLAVNEVKVGDRRMFAGIVRDISDLKEQQVHLQAILDNAVDAIITITDRGIVESVNPATVELFGYSAGEIVGENIKMLMPMPYSHEHDGYLENYLKSGKKKIIGIGREVVGQRKDGTTFPMHLGVSEVRVGNRVRFTGMIRDITELKEAEQKLEKINEQLEERVRLRTAELHEAQATLLQKEKLATLGQVSGGIAHEIRNPLNAVKTSTFYLLHAKDPKPEKLREHLNRIDRQVTMIDSVVTALSDVAKLPDPKFEPASIGSVLIKVLKETSLPESIEVELELPDDLPSVLIDEHQIPIVFRNLVRNARDAMPDGGKLSVSAVACDDKVIVHVKDTGIGIAPENLTRITEPLFSTKARGMGLGLSISRTILEKNQGQLKVESELGKGTEFKIELRSAAE